MSRIQNLPPLRRRTARPAGRPTSFGAIGFATLRFPLLILFFSFTACSSGGGTTEPGALGPLAPLVGSWRATSMVVISKDDPTVAPDVVEQYGATFTLDVGADGRYTARLGYGGQTGPPEEGAITGTATTLTLDPDGDEAPRDGTWTLGGGVLVINSETAFDFNFDGNPESAYLHLELVRR